MKISLLLQQKLNIKLTESLAFLIDKESSIKKFHTRETILLEGEKGEGIYFIISGIIRGYYIDNGGNDITKCFSTENEFFSSEGLRTNSVSSFTIETLSQCECVKIPYSLAKELINNEYEFKNLFIQLNLREVEKLENRSRCLAILNAEERYIDFLNNSNEILKNIELKFIASYLGIRPPSLSRIRKKLKNLQ